MPKLAAIPTAALILIGCIGCISFTGCSDGASAPSETSPASGVSESTQPESTPPATAPEDKPAAMIEMSSQQLVNNIRIGWNLGGSLEACRGDLDGDGSPDKLPETDGSLTETLWGNPPVTRELFKALSDDGVNAVRIPVTWREHIDAEGNIDPEWLNRVEQVVSYAYGCGMYVIINVHHDGASDEDSGAWLRAAGRDRESVVSRYERLWEQIAERFKNYNERVLFESMNDVSFGYLPMDKAYETLNLLNRTFVNVIRQSGGNNPSRHILIAGYRADIFLTCDGGFVMPDDPAGKSIVSVHYYTPWMFCVTGDYDEWGTPAEERQMERIIEKLRVNFTDKGIPAIITEYSASGSDEDSAVYFCERLTKLCRDSEIAAFLWDDGETVDRSTYEWRSPRLLKALTKAAGREDYIPVKGGETDEIDDTTDTNDTDEPDETTATTDTTDTTDTGGTTETAE